MKKVKSINPQPKPVLTKRQQRVLNMIRRYVKKTGFPPSRIEINKAMGFSSPNAAQDYVNILVEKGALKRTPGIARGLKVSD